MPLAVPLTDSYGVAHNEQDELGDPGSVDTVSIVLIHPVNASRPVSLTTPCAGSSHTGGTRHLCLPGVRSPEPSSRAGRATSRVPNLMLSHPPAFPGLERAQSGYTPAHRVANLWEGSMATTSGRDEGAYRRLSLRFAVMLASVIVLAAVLMSAGSVMAAPGDWPSYGHDVARTGVSPDQGSLGTIGVDWTSVSLDGRLIYAQPLVVADRVIVATEGDSLFALDAATGSVVWSRNLGTPVPKSDLPGGNIDPSGITGTPVADVVTGTIYAVAFVKEGGDHHELFAVDLATGTVDWHRAVDPPGLSALVEQERGALTLSGGRVYVAYGGLWGDVGQYKGAVVSSAADGTGALTSYVVPTTRRGGIWNPAGPVVDDSGDLWVATGNTVSTSAFDYGNSVIRLSPALSVLDYFAPTNWASLNSADLDLCTLDPVLLPNGRVLVIGKSGTAYLLNSANLGHVSTALATVGIGGSPYGSAAVLGSRVFVPCSASLKALDVSTSQVQVAWTVSGASSSPIIAAGYVWSMGYTGLLKAVLPATGAVVYTRQFGTPPSRFTSMAAAGGRLFVPDRTKITALSLHGAPVVTGLSPAVGSPSGGTTVTIDGTGFEEASAVTFGAEPATSFAVISPTRITATAPSHAMERVDVVVTTAWGSSDASGTADDFTYANRYEQTDPRIVKRGTWSDFVKTAASGGSYGRSRTAGAKVTVYFTGTRLDWIAMKGTTTGIADVYLDGVKKATINLAATTASYQIDVWSTGALASGPHFVDIVRDAASASGKYLTLDAFDVAGTIDSPPPAPTRYEQTDPHIVKTGVWSNFSRAAASGGSYGRSSTSGAEATITFTGTRLDWIAMEGTTPGMADVYVDGVLATPTPIDLGAAVAAYQVDVWTTGTLIAGTHVVRLVRNGGSAPGKYLTLDAVDIWGIIQ